jgi:hypothetical protein
MTEKDIAQKAADLAVKKMMRTINQQLKNQNDRLTNQDAMLNGIKKAQEDLAKSQDEYHKMTSPMFEWFWEMNMGKKMRLNYLRAIGVWSGVIIGLSAVGGIVWTALKLLATALRH